MLGLHQEWCDLIRYPIFILAFCSGCTTNKRAYYSFASEAGSHLIENYSVQF
jgi:hypothetical protein